MTKHFYSLAQRFCLLLALSLSVTGCYNLKPDSNSNNPVPESSSAKNSSANNQIRAKYLNHDAVARYDVPSNYTGTSQTQSNPDQNKTKPQKTDSNDDIDLTNAQGFPIFDKNDDLNFTTFSIWPRIRAGFAIKDNVNHSDLKKQIAWFSSHRAYLGRVLKRADPFLYFITQETEKRDLPTELVLLPIVESAYQPFAYSNGRAAGIWQFIPSTGKLYGLKQNWWYDGRRDIDASTRAALNYLRNLNKIFNGNWLLTLAAYNSGSGTVKRAIRHNRRLHLPTDFWHLKLPKETRAYVPKLLALKEIIEHPQKYNISLRCIADAPGFVQVKIHAQIDLALAAKLANVDLNELYRYNPAFNRWATNPDGPHTLILPPDAAETFRKNYASLPADRYMKWIRHKIRNGETLSQIAEKYDTSTRHIRQVNNLHGNTIRAGRHILIPVASLRHSAYVLSASQRLKKLQTHHYRNTRRIQHIVKRGESFWKIAREYRVNMNKLAKWNGMSIYDPLKPGHKLVIYKNETVTKLASRSVLYENSDRHIIQRISYTVKSGDSLSRIANHYNVRIEDLHRWNAIKGKYLQPGQRLKLYINVTEQADNRG